MLWGAFVVAGALPKLLNPCGTLHLVWETFHAF